ncbi:hypothetical protein WJX64_02690 [Leifsonia sp. YIM 134122]|uniref:DUF7882 domain-containing protein n=1 Tax=Leifsonia stereocauli TaxID=3134136 RepID=A0ABU9W188_9MICO
MGILHYGTQTFDMDDRLLAHLQMIIGIKLRRSESFFMTWNESSTSVDARRAIWIDNGVPIYMEYDGRLQPPMNMDWAEKLANSANKGGGLIIMAEDIPLTSEVPE